MENQAEIPATRSDKETHHLTDKTAEDITQDLEERDQQFDHQEQDQDAEQCERNRDPRCKFGRQPREQVFDKTNHLGTSGNIGNSADHKEDHRSGEEKQEDHLDLRGQCGDHAAEELEEGRAVREDLTHGRDHTITPYDIS